ncbi:hypothetical protein B0T26DRAFT_669505 [Lasiosphaeria miniovina]|uniref:Uncharacterized protein n=1 Tax=Lasiosphaeria miniovina TaxID=1954250 RepID=A0AA40EF68_9PEZI|nr:uncharacterized protein B0T26DRAFT_669505 [Lasiosphaeria miniovina]KAK0733053.1 hypothetical protein B0T26DRAFT_669505 [Lasiosphaeria miniovina]
MDNKPVMNTSPEEGGVPPPSKADPDDNKGDTSNNRRLDGLCFLRKRESTFLLKGSMWTIPNKTVNPRQSLTLATPPITKTTSSSSGEHVGSATAAVASLRYVSLVLPGHILPTFKSHDFVQRGVDIHSRNRIASSSKLMKSQGRSSAYYVAAATQGERTSVTKNSPGEARHSHEEEDILVATPHCRLQHPRPARMVNLAKFEMTEGERSEGTS